MTARILMDTQYSMATFSIEMRLLTKAIFKMTMNMAIARSKVFNPDVTGYYHCIVRCVRRSYLCGYDKLTGRSFEHRRQWIKDRLTFLLEIFSIDCFSYAVMNNHLHMVIRNNPEVSKSWTNEQVAVRWRKLFPKFKQHLQAYEDDIRQIAANSELVDKYRKRLSCISWFNRCMNENIARRANKEDECKGRFWEGRFIAQKLDSTGAIIACCAYVDLNPIRAKVAATPESSDYTSIQDRIRKLLSIDDKNHGRLPRLVGIKEISELTDKDYIELVDSTGRELISGKRGRIDPGLSPILERIRLNPNFFIYNSRYQSTLFANFIGSVKDLTQHAERLGQKFVKGIANARRLFLEEEAIA